MVSAHFTVFNHCSLCRHLAMPCPPYNLSHPCHRPLAWTWSWYVFGKRAVFTETFLPFCPENWGHAGTLTTILCLCKPGGTLPKGTALSLLSHTVLASSQLFSSSRCYDCGLLDVSVGQSPCLLFTPPGLSVVSVGYHQKKSRQLMVFHSLAIVQKHCPCPCGLCCLCMFFVLFWMCLDL